ncbi:MAG: 4Fe-4S binding protein [Thermoleophilia bacterium]|nr:4Fe-4S binding protein [Thermoleophilia bacterium]
MTDATKSRSKKTGQIPVFDARRCKQCGICTHFCPTSAIRPDSSGSPKLVDPQACTSCRLCEQLCPDFAVEMTDREAVPPDEDTSAAAEHPLPQPEVCHVHDPCEG